MVTRYSRLAACLPCDALLGEVRYIDYDSEGFSPASSLFPLMHKRLPYRDEQEVRALLPYLPKEIFRAPQVAARLDDQGDEQWWVGPSGGLWVRADLMRELLLRGSQEIGRGPTTAETDIGEVESPMGIRVHVDLEQLLVEIVMSPGMAVEDRGRVKALARQISRRLRVEASALEGQPTF